MIDKRRHYVLVVDTETANTLTETVPAEIGEDGEIITPERVRMDMSNVLVYDCGWAVVDTKGNIYETASFVNRDIFNDERDLMRTAYYNWKIPRYVEELRPALVRWLQPMKSGRLCLILSSDTALKRMLLIMPGLTITLAGHSTMGHLL